MADPMRIRAAHKDGVTEVRVLMSHPMETGQRKNAAGDTIPFSQISWTVSAPGSTVPGVIPAGTFNGGTQNLATIPANRYIENCHSFGYANSAIRAAGTYEGRVTYTLTTP